jgi:hypothetical protein
MKDIQELRINLQQLLIWYRGLKTQLFKAFELGFVK